MVEQNQPVDVGKDKVYAHQKQIEDSITSIPYKDKSRSLPELIRQVDENEPHSYLPPHSLCIVL